MAVRPAIVEAGAELLVEAEGGFVPVQFDEFFVVDTHHRFLLYNFKVVCIFYFISMKCCN